MFCPNCQNNLPEGSAFCGECGTKIQVASAPVQEPMLGRWKHLFKKASVKGKMLALFTMIFTAIICIMLWSSYSNSVNGSIDEIPALEFVLEQSGSKEDIDQMKDAFKDEVDRLDNMLDYNTDELSAKEEKVAREFIEAAEECADTLSINNFLAAADSVEAIMEIDELEVYSEDFDMIESGVVSALNVIKMIFLVVMLVPFAFIFFGGIFRKRGLVIAGMILSTFYTILFAGLVSFGIILVLEIAMIVFITIVNKEYLRYRQATFTGELV